MTLPDYETKDESYFNEEVDSDEEAVVTEYDITASPNDFNVKTIFDFIESGSVKIPAFQRNYVWDIKRASKLIESLVIGLPIPQIFLYEESRNKFLVIDGQQRLMSIFYFLKQRFPHREKRAELRRIFDSNGAIPSGVLHDDLYFGPFNLQLPENLPNRPNRFNGKNYNTLDDYKTTLDLRVVRYIIIKQNKPADDDSSIYEVFSRLNTGGVNLNAQEIRTSLYHSEFYNALFRINVSPEWRRLIGVKEPDFRMRDIEVLLRAAALMIDGSKYKPSMANFLNRFSKSWKASSTAGATKKRSAEDAKRFEALVFALLDSIKSLPETALFGRATSKFNALIFGKRSAGYAV